MSPLAGIICTRMGTLAIKVDLLWANPKKCEFLSAWVSWDLNKNVLLDSVMEQRLFI